MEESLLKVPPKQRMAKNSRPNANDINPLCNLTENFSRTNSSESNKTVAKVCHWSADIIDRVVDAFWTEGLSPLVETQDMESLQAILSIARAAANRMWALSSVVPPLFCSFKSPPFWMIVFKSFNVFEAVFW